MKLVRYGTRGCEKPGLFGEDGVLRDLSAHVADIGPDQISPAGLDTLRAIDPARFLQWRAPPGWAHLLPARAASSPSD